MRALRTSVIALGLALIFSAGWIAWHRAHVPESDEQTVRAALDAIARAIQDRSTARVADYLSPHFTWDGSSRSDFNRSMAGAFWQWRNVQLTISGEQIHIAGPSGSTTGHYAAKFQPSDGAPVETHSGEFQLLWTKENGQWTVYSANASGTGSGG